MEWVDVVLGLLCWVAAWPTIEAGWVYKVGFVLSRERGARGTSTAFLREDAECAVGARQSYSRHNKAEVCYMTVWRARATSTAVRRDSNRPGGSTR